MLSQIEFAILNSIQQIRTPNLDQIIKCITRLGNAGIIWIILTLILLCIPKKRKTGLILLVALCVDELLCDGILKHIFRRLRPCDVNTAIQLIIPRPNGWSFPSGHTAVAFTSVTALFLAKEKKLWKIACVLAVLIAFSRLYLYVHYPTDILAGIISGIAAGYIGYSIEQFFEKKRQNKKA